MVYVDLLDHCKKGITTVQRRWMIAASPCFAPVRTEVIYVVGLESPERHPGTNPQEVRMTKLNIMASRHSAFYSPMICTIAGGFLEKEGLTGEYHVVEAGGTSGGAVAEGRMDVARAAVSASWSPLIRVRDPRSLILRRSTGTTVSLLQPVNLIRIFHGTSF
ncbi:MAG: hypothetical protein CM1200mP39_04380 [Dehalococcoidia bacterium]|nr:MAG: hypothetical protein CM1200mP39_04380 [Dehalococcoidia bacterium]